MAVAYDEYTQDIPENRLLHAALHRLACIRMRQNFIHQQISRLRPLFDLVTLVTYGKGRLPPVPYTRLNQHYRPALELARLILANSSLELHRGDVPATSFLVNMNQVFERFLYVALGEALGLPSTQWRKNESLELDKAGNLRVKPDCTWWYPSVGRAGPHLRFLADAKYKHLSLGPVETIGPARLQP